MLGEVEGALGANGSVGVGGVVETAGRFHSLLLMPLRGRSVDFLLLLGSEEGRDTTGREMLEAMSVPLMPVAFGAVALVLAAEVEIWTEFLFAFAFPFFDAPCRDLDGGFLGWTDPFFFLGGILERALQFFGMS